MLKYQNMFWGIGFEHYMFVIFILFSVSILEFRACRFVPEARLYREQQKKGREDPAP
jgi:hypothetical protein